MAVATPMNQAGLQQLIVNCDRRLASVAASIDEAGQVLALKASELQTITARASAREQQLHIAGQSVAAVKEELAQLRLRVELAEGTLSSDNGADQIKTLEKKVLRLEKEEHDLQVKLSKEASTDANREAAARIVANQVQESITSLTREQQTTHLARESAFNDLGQVKKQAVMSKLKELHETIARTRTEAASAVQALDAYADEAVRTLNEWPVLQQQLRPFLPVYRDAATSLLEAQISLLAVLLNHGKLAQMDSDLVQRVLQSRFASFNQILELSDRDLWNVFGSGDMTNIRERREQAEKVLSAYRASKSKVR